jgi:hypothetical protein
VLKCRASSSASGALFYGAARKPAAPPGSVGWLTGYEASPGTWAAAGFRGFLSRWLAVVVIAASVHCHARFPCARAAHPRRAVCQGAALVHPPGLPCSRRPGSFDGEPSARPAARVHAKARARDDGRPRVKHKRRADGGSGSSPLIGTIALGAKIVREGQTRGMRSGVSRVPFCRTEGRLDADRFVGAGARPEIGLVKAREPALESVGERWPQRVIPPVRADVPALAAALVPDRVL